MAKNSRTLNLDQLWEIANASAKSCNGLMYHPCCDIWSTRAAKVKRASHTKSLHWRQITASLDKASDDKKGALLAKMTEEGWQLPVVLNKSCQPQPRLTVEPQFPFRPHNPDHLSQDFRTSIAPIEFSEYIPNHLPNQDQGMLIIISSFSSRDDENSRANP